MEFKDTLTSSEQYKTLLRLLKYLNPYKKDIFLGLIYIILATIGSISGPIILKNVIDKYITTGNIEIKGMVFFLGLYVLTNLMFAIFKYLQVYIFNKIGHKITRDLRVELFTKLQTLSMRYFDQTPAGRIVSRVTNDTDAISDMLNNVMAVVISSVFTMIGIIIAMISLDLTLTLIIICFIPVMIIIIYLYQKYSTKYYQIIRSKLSELNTKLSESLSGMNIIQMFNQEKRLLKEFENINDDYYKASLKNLRLDSLLLMPIVVLLINIALAIVFSVAGIRSMTGLVSTGVVVAFVDYIWMFFDPMGQIMERLAIYQQAIVAAHRIFTILDNNETNPYQGNNKDAIISDASIEFNNVSFSYDGENEVLSNISFKVNPGETVALVGHTGSGKSSIINVMMRFYEFQKGDVLIDGHSIRDFKIEELRRNTGLVLQDPFIYFGTINDNIRLLNKDITDKQIKEACEFVQANEFIENLDKKYDHLVIERGSAFSTGQKQLLIFARTVATNPKILVLDEATANIDSETEEMIQNGLNVLKKGRTTIAIAHRLSTIKDANNIIVLDKGRIIEQGTHDELIELRGTYYAMYQLQKNED